MYKVPLMKPHISAETKQRVMDVLDSGYLTEGPVTAEFEQAVAKYVGVPHTIAVTSCTTGLEIALRCLGIGPGDEVIVPDYTYPATACAVNIVGATAVIVDVHPNTMVMDMEALEEAITGRTKAIIPVSLFGNPVDFDRINQLKQKHDFYVVEDAACALGATYQGKTIGSLADLSVFSCHPRKFITTGEGGLIATANDDWAAWIRSYKLFGITSQASRGGTSFSHIGTNSKLSNVLAAIGLGQMGEIDTLLEDRQAIALRYLQLLADKPGVILPSTTESGVHSWQTFCVFVENRDAVMETMRAQGVEAQIGTYSLHMHEAYEESDLIRIPASLRNSRYVYDHALALPLFNGMTESDQDLVVSELLKAVSKRS